MIGIDDIRDSLKPELQLLSQKMEQSLMSSNKLMNKVVEDYLQAKGKLIRPILVILTAKLFGDVNDDVISSASAVELLHNASLIHDDVVDNSDLRRGAPTVNSIWDNHIAVLVGDFLCPQRFSRQFQRAIYASLPLCPTSVRCLVSVKLTRYIMHATIS